MYKHLKPIDKVCGYDVRPGIFMLNGARPVNDGINFTINSIYATSCTLLLFKPNAKFPFARLPFPESYRIGHTYSMIVYGLDYEEFEYAYSFDGP